MDANSTIQLLQKGFHVTLGATASLLESLQDSEKRAENLANLRLELDELTQILETKGELTETEARNFVESVLAKQGGQTSASTPGDRATWSPSTPTATSTTTNLQLELQELTTQLAALRAELVRDRQEPGV